MNRDWRTILRFAILGLAIAAVFFVFLKTDYLSESWAGVCMFWASIAMCPGFFVLVLDVAGSEVPVSNPALVWLVIGLFNCLYYAAIGAVYVDLRKPRGSVAQI